MSPSGCLRRYSTYLDHWLSLAYNSCKKMSRVSLGNLDRYLRRGSLNKLPGSTASAFSVVRTSLHSSSINLADAAGILWNKSTMAAAIFSCSCPATRLATRPARLPPAASGSSWSWPIVFCPMAFWVTMACSSHFFKCCSRVSHTLNK